MSLFKRNCNLLKESYPDLVAALLSYKDDGHVELFKGQRGQWTAQWKLDDRQVLLHSAFDPVREAKELFANINLHRFASVYYVGSGLGYHWKHLLDLTENYCMIYLVEPDLAMLHAAFSVTDVEPLVRSHRVVWLWGSEENMRSILNLQWNDLTKLAKSRQLCILDFLVSRRELPAVTQKMHDLIIDFTKYSRLIVGNSVTDTLYGFMNTLKNLKYIEQTPKLDNIKGKLSGPVVIMAAGPSLDKNIHFVERYRDRVCVFAVDTILNKLLSRGIEPDVVFALERDEIIYNWFFASLNALPKKTLIVGVSVVDQRVYDLFNERSYVFLRKEDGIQGLFAEMLNDETIATGQSVAHLAFSFARVLGLGPIILVGQDLAYGENGDTHSQGTHYDNPTPGETDNEDEDLWIDGYYGTPVRTQKWWKMFRDWFELEIERTTVPVINATEGGADIKGTQRMPLEEALRRFAVNLKPDVAGCLTKGNKETRLRHNILAQGINEKYVKYKSYEMIIDEHTRDLETLTEKVRTQKEARRILDDIENNLLIEFNDAWLRYACMPEFVNILEELVELMCQDQGNAKYTREVQVLINFYSKLRQIISLMNRLMNEIAIIS